jgi:hypothetical protein
MRRLDWALAAFMLLVSCMLLAPDGLAAETPNEQSANTEFTFTLPATAPLSAGKVGTVFQLCRPGDANCGLRNYEGITSKPGGVPLFQRSGLVIGGNPVRTNAAYICRIEPQIRLIARGSSGPPVQCCRASPRPLWFPLLR